MTKSKIASIVAIGAVFVGSFAAIAYAYDPESSEEAKTDFCQSLSDLSSTVMSYDGITPLTATNDELDAAADDIEGAWNEVVDDAEDWANAYDNELAQAYDDLYWEIQSLPGDNTAAENLDAVEDELGAFPEAYRATFDGSGCTTA
jgi:inorganic triphosphatase YgiF